MKKKIKSLGLKFKKKCKIATNDHYFDQFYRWLRRSNHLNPLPLFFFFLASSVLMVQVGSGPTVMGPFSTGSTPISSSVDEKTYRAGSSSTGLFLRSSTEPSLNPRDIGKIAVLGLSVPFPDYYGPVLVRTGPLNISSNIILYSS